METFKPLNFCLLCDRETLEAAQAMITAKNKAPCYNDS